MEKLRALWMCGSATFTIVMSSTTINWQEAMTRSAIPLPPPRSPAAVSGRFGPFADAGCELVMAHRALVEGR
ncbi:hypothetical protein GCM10020367_62430 [Streptomyces sannanensis]|uniref:Secreted protein n=1 Tax=Streptomyces sannanensis TaxID=285536 RepID=A0ABP6SLM5_9ACTN